MRQRNQIKTGRPQAGLRLIRFRFAVVGAGRALGGLVGVRNVPPVDAKEREQIIAGQRGAVLVLAFEASGDIPAMMRLKIDRCRALHIVLSGVLQFIEAAGGVPTSAKVAPIHAALFQRHNNRIIAAGVAQDEDAAYEIEIPSTLTNPWTVTRTRGPIAVRRLVAPRLSS